MDAPWDEVVALMAGMSLLELEAFDADLDRLKELVQVELERFSADLDRFEAERLAAAAARPE